MRRTGTTAASRPYAAQSEGMAPSCFVGARGAGGEHQDGQTDRGQATVDHPLLQLRPARSERDGVIGDCLVAQPQYGRFGVTEPLASGSDRPQVMSTRLFSVVIDAADPRALGHWWRDALGWEVMYQAPDEVVVVPPNALEVADIPGLVFVEVNDPKRGKNRVHLDLAAQSPEDQAVIVARLLAAGATHADVGQGDDVPWVVLADPEGNEFCVLDARPRYRGSSALAAIVLDTQDPEALAPFWMAATGRIVGDEDDEYLSLRHPDGHLPDLELSRTDDDHTVKNRVHLDVAPWADGDLDEEVDRLLALGATRADVGQGDDVTWVVLADPGGNEFCVLRPR